MLTSFRIAVRTLVWILIGLGLAVVLFMIRLDAGPIELGWLQPRIERALAPESGTVAVSAERIELRLNQERRTFELVGVNVRYRATGAGAGQSAPFLSFPEVELALSVEALLKRGMIAASELYAKAPSLIVRRDADGIIGLYSEAEYAENAAPVDFGGFLRRFALASEADQRLAFLERLQIEGARVALYDRSSASAVTARKADMALIRREGGVDAWLRADIPQTTVHPASVQISAHIRPDDETVPFTIDVADLMPADLPALWPLPSPSIPAALGGMRLPVRATIEGEVGLDGDLSPLDVDLQADAGMVDLPALFAEPLEIGALQLDARIDIEAAAAEIEHASVVSRGAELTASGRTVWRKGAGEVRLDLAASHVRAEDLPAFWPIGLGHDARLWVVENIRTGVVSTASARLDLDHQDLTHRPLHDGAVKGRFDFEGLSVRYLDEMPPIEGALGDAVFDADRMHFEVKAGRNAGVTLNGGSVTITGMGKPGKDATQLHVLAEADSGIEPMLALLDHPPLEVVQELGIAPADTAGHVAATLEVRLPLHKEVTEEEAVILAEAELSGLAIDRLPKLGADARLDDGAFSLTVDEDSVRLDGKAAVNGIPLAIDVTEPLSKQEQTPPRRIDLAGRLSRSQLERLQVPVDGMEGDVAFKATVSETPTHFWIDLEADLKSLALAPPGLVWRKDVGQDGMLRASIAKAIDGPLEVKHFDVSAGDLAVEGALLLSDRRLQSLTLDRLRLAGSDVAIRYAPGSDGGHDLAIEGTRLDLDALFGKEPDAGDSFRRFHVILRTGELRARGIELLNVEADAVHAERGWRSASLIGSLPSSGKVAVELTPDGDGRRLEIRSENAGDLIEALDLGQRVAGGRLLLTARLEADDPMVAEGRFEINDFVLQDAPLLARMLTLASLTGIGNLLGGEGIRVDHLILPFSLKGDELTLTDGLLRGSELGLTVKGDIDWKAETLNLAGTIIPVYTLNRLIGKVPVIGRILTGTDGRGAFAATYSIEGPNDAPTVYVNPLSILTPGLLRDLFGAVISGTGEPPDLRATDD
ncbi:MAG: AsmA-like C-terminal domain-containing protein [Alphaproteobacteria bacterium]